MTTTSNHDDPAFDLHIGGKIEIASRTPLDGPDDLSLAYTPGVGRVSQAIADEPHLVWDLTGRSNAVAVLSNGTTVLGLGNIGPEAAMPENVAVVATGRSDFPNQINNVLAFPGGVPRDARRSREAASIDTKRAAADALAALVPDPTAGHIIPGAFEPGVADAVADAVRRSVLEQGHVRRRGGPVHS